MSTDETCFVIGCGSSIRGYDFSTLDSYYTIGTNHIIRDYPNLKCGLFLDDLFFKEHREAVDNFKGELWVHVRAIPEDYNRDNLHVVRTSLKNVNTDPNENWLLGGLSGIAALNLAILKGYKTIYLLGYDMYGSNYHDTEKVPFAGSEKLIERFEKFKGMADIYNCNPDSLITAFPKVF